MWLQNHIMCERLPLGSLAGRRHEPAVNLQPIPASGASRR